MTPDTTLGGARPGTTASATPAATPATDVPAAQAVPAPRDVPAPRRPADSAGPAASPAPAAHAPAAARVPAAPVALAVALAAPLLAVLLHLVASGAAVYVTWIVLVVGLVAWSPVSRRWPRVNRLGPAVAALYLGAGAFLLLSAG